VFTGSTEREVRLYVMGSHPRNCKHPVPQQCKHSELNESENEVCLTVVKTLPEMRYVGRINILILLYMTYCIPA